VESVEGRRVRTEESSVYAVVEGSAKVVWGREGEGRLGEAGNIPGGTCAEDVERRPSVDGRRIVSGSAFDSTYWVIQRGAGEMRRLRGQFERRRCGSSRPDVSACT
jgi:hypothetical protein